MTRPGGAETRSVSALHKIARVQLFAEKVPFWCLDRIIIAWGEEFQFVNTDSNHSKFTGKERDSESGPHSFGGRYYSNGLGRFITSDWARSDSTKQKHRCPCANYKRLYLLPLRNAHAPL